MNFFKQGIINRLVFFLPFFILAILLVLSFYCHPTREDLAIYYGDHEKGLSSFIREFYHNDSSRYFSFPLIFALFNGDFVFYHYYIIPLLMISGLWAGFYFLTGFVAKRFMDLKAGKGLQAWIAALLLIAFSNSVFEPATLIYWISGSLTYLPSFILFLLLLMILLKDHSVHHKRLIPFLGSILITICICGSNEISLYFIAVTFVLAQFIYYRLYQQTSLLIWVLVVVILLSFFLLILPGGSGQRAHHFSKSYSFYAGILNGALYTIRTILKVLASPLSWLAIAGAGWGGRFVKTEVKQRIIATKINPLHLMLYVLFALFFFYFLVFFISGELLPPRANSLMCFYVFLSFLFIAFFAGSSSTEAVKMNFSKITMRLGAVALLIILVSNRLFIDGAQDLFSGYIYNKVYNERTATIAEARKQGKSTVKLEPYHSDYQKYSTALTGNIFGKRLVEKMEETPRLIHYSDPLADTAFYIRYYAACYKIDMIEYLGIKYPKMVLPSKQK